MDPEKSEIWKFVRLRRKSRDRYIIEKQYQTLIEKLVKEKLETKAIYLHLVEKGFLGSYLVVYRLVQRMQKQALRNEEDLH